MKLNKIKIVTCKITNARFLFNVFNSAVNGEFFFSKKKLVYKNHLSWLKNKLSSKHSKIFIGKIIKNKEEFGYIRFDKLNEKIWEISIAILPAYYGQSLGTRMMREAIKIFKKRNITLVAIVKKKNQRSIKSFEKNGFKISKMKKKRIVSVNPIDLRKEVYLIRK